MSVVTSGAEKERFPRSGLDRDVFSGRGASTEAQPLPLEFGADPLQAEREEQTPPDGITEATLQCKAACAFVCVPEVGKTLVLTISSFEYRPQPHSGNSVFLFRRRSGAMHGGAPPAQPSGAGRDGSPETPGGCCVPKSQPGSIDTVFFWLSPRPPPPPGLGLPPPRDASRRGTGAPVS